MGLYRMFWVLGKQVWINVNDRRGKITKNTHQIILLFSLRVIELVLKIIFDDEENLEVDTCDSGKSMNLSTADSEYLFFRRIKAVNVLRLRDFPRHIIGMGLLL